MADEQALLELVGASRLGVLVTIKRDGRPQLSTVSHRYEPTSRRISASVTSSRAKTRNLRRDPRLALQVSSGDGWSWAVVEGTASLTPVAAAPDDETVDALVELYRALQGEHPDWDAYRAAMVGDGRLVVSFTVQHAYGQTA